MFSRRPSLARHVAVAVSLTAYVSCTSPHVAPVHDASFKPEADEQRLWDGAAKLDALVEQRGLLYQDEELQKYLDRVTAGLLPDLGAADAQVRVRAFKNPLLNAAALPNGSVYLFTGILARMENEAQLATVLGHELAHFIGRHALRDLRNQQSQLATAHFVLFTFALTGLLLVGAPLMERVFQAQVTGYSRDLEREADSRSLQAMIAAGYDPREAPKMFIQLQHDEEEAGVKEPYVYGSHPRLAERIQSYQSYLAEGPAPPAGSAALRVESDAFNDAISQLLLDNAELDLDLHRVEKARCAIERQLAHRPQSARGYFALGELHRRSGDSEEKRAAAVAAYRQSLQLDPGYAPAHRELGLIYRDQGRTAEAQAELTRYVELAADAPDRAIIQGYLDDLHPNPMRGGAR